MEEYKLIVKELNSGNDVMLDATLENENNQFREIRLARRDDPERQVRAAGLLVEALADKIGLKTADDIELFSISVQDNNAKAELNIIVDDKPYHGSGEISKDTLSSKTLMTAVVAALVDALNQANGWEKRISVI